MQIERAELDEQPSFGEWTLEVSGEFVSADGVVNGDQVWVAITQMAAHEAQPEEVRFEPGERVTLHFTGATGGAIPSPEGCVFTTSGVAGGAMSPVAPQAEDECEAGLAGVRRELPRG